MVEFNPVQTNQRPISEKIKQRAWSMINQTVFRWTPWIARKFRRCLCSIMGAELAGDVSLSSKSRIDYPWNLEMGSLSSVGDGVWIYGLDRIVIGKKCCIGDDVRLITGSHSLSRSTFDLVTKPIIICDNVWVATAAIVLPGVTIGEGAVVAAGSVVTKNVEPWTVVGGNPACFIKKRVINE